MSESVKPIPRERLKFIDMARSIAILLMLEGHFIGLSLHESFKDDNNPIYFSWNFVRGFTAPMFFTVTGVVFVYLLTNNPDAKFFNNRRVSKGFRRSLELLMWGYLLQVNLKHIWTYLTGEVSEWVYAFHVLQAIGVGIAMLLLIFGLYKLIGKGALFLYYFLAATLLFSFYPYFKSLPEGVYVLNGWPQIIQNMIKGPNSVFPIIPWVAFTLYGGMVGALLNRFHEHVRKVWFPLCFIGLGLILNLFGFAIFKFIDELSKTMHFSENLDFVFNAWLYGRLGQVLIVIGVLMFIEKYFHIKDSLFIKIGQNTLSIYIVHVMILYSGVFGIGLNHYIKNIFTPWQAVFAAASFITFFVFFTKYLEQLEAVYKKLWDIILWPFKTIWAKIRA
ncbi:MAG: acyltransferase [Bacteroidetes bacterium]|nr:acyltransferase [Bacteroidota bacterium]